MPDEVAIISDIHANVHALRAVLTDIEERDVADRICLGDVVGYGANPAECIEAVRNAGFKIIKGNHDAMASDEDDMPELREEIREMMFWTRQQLNTEQRAWLDSLPLTLESADYQAVHASLHHPAEWRYVLTPGAAALHFQHQTKPLCFIGHSHKPAMFIEGEEHPIHITNLENLRHDRKQVVNVGSTGQPRDRDPRACYLLYRREQRDVWWRRVSYDVSAAQKAIMSAGLSPLFAARLEEGR